MTYEYVHQFNLISCKWRLSCQDIKFWYILISWKETTTIIAAAL